MIDVAGRIAALADVTERAWRRKDFVEAEFAAIARDALASVPTFDDAPKEEILAAIASSRSTVAPSAALRAEAITLFEGPRFTIRVRTAVGELPPLRSAGAIGAYRLLTGAAVYKTATFTVAKEYDPNFAIGSLSRVRFDLLETGAVVAFEPDTIHSVSLLDAAGAWLVMETSERFGNSVVPFVFPGVRVGLDPIDHATDNRLKCYTVLHQIDPSRCALLLESTVRGEDPRTCFLLLRHAATLRPAIDLQRLYEAARPVFDGRGEIAIAAIERLARSRVLESHLTRELAPAERLLVVALEWAEKRRALGDLLTGSAIGAEASALVEHLQRQPHPLGALVGALD